MTSWSSYCLRFVLVRRLVQRGKALMGGGYRQLEQLDGPGEGRSACAPKRP